MLATKLRSFEEAFDLLNARFFENVLPGLVFRP